MSKLIIGVIGYRSHSQKIISHLLKIKKNNQVISYCYKDDQLENLIKKNKDKSLKYTSKIKDLNVCKAIFISSATGSHFDYIKLFIKNDAYIYCEKPGPISLKEINYIKKLPSKAKKKLYFGHNLLKSEIYFDLKKILSKGKYGKPICAQINITNGISFKESLNSNWRFRSKSIFKKITGNVGIHYLGLLIFLFGKIKKVNINQFGIIKKNKIDNCLIDINFLNNFYSRIFLSYSSVLDEEIKIYFSNGILLFNGKKLSAFHPRNTFDNKKNFIKPNTKVLKKYSSSWSEKSLTNSIDYFLKISLFNQNFAIKDFNQFLKINEILCRY
jgi:predicted dehydrogenase